MQMKRIPIRKRIRRVLMLAAAASLLVSAIVGSISMFNIRNDSGRALTDQLEINLSNTLKDKAALADAQFGKYAEYLKGFVTFIEDMYLFPETYIDHEVLRPDAQNAGIMAMQRYLRDTDVTLESVWDEVNLFGNLELYWGNAIRQNENVITTVYLGTESGLLVSYDKASDLGVSESGGESYFNFLTTNWYPSARESGKAGFTDIYEDAYGRGPTITYSAPFYGAKGEFKGVVCMDMLITDIYQQIVSMDLGENGAVYLIDNSGITLDTDRQDMISISDVVPDSRVLASIEQKKDGFIRSKDNVYYFYTPVESTGWMLCIRIPESTVLQSVSQMNAHIRRVFIVFFGFFLLMLIGVWFVSNRFSKQLTEPMVELGQDAVIISRGDLDHQARIRSNDEIGDLAEHFNAMSASLKKYITDLTQVTAEKERIGAELNVATQIQADMLPRIFPAFPERKDFDIFATMTPAKEVGGDFYDFFLLDENHLGLVMADVSGKGVPAALFMVIAKTLIKNRAQMGGGPAEVLNYVNNQLCEGNEAELFVTVWFAILDLTTGKGMAANAGHEHPVIRRANGRYELVEYRHSPAVATMEGLRFREHAFELHPGDSMFVYTDGVPEATNANNELFGTDRMLEALNQNPEADPYEILNNVQREVSRFVGDAPQFDDITMLGIRYFGQKEKTMEANLKVPASLDELPNVLAFVDEKLESIGCPMKTQMQIDVAVEEVFVNIAHYAYTPETGNAVITTRISPEKDAVEIEFRDSGIPFNPLEKPDPDVSLSAEDRKIGGLGIYMVKKSMDSMTYARRDGQNILTITKKVR